MSVPAAEVFALVTQLVLVIVGASVLVERCCRPQNHSAYASTPLTSGGVALLVLRSDARLDPVGLLAMTGAVTMPSRPTPTWTGLSLIPSSGTDR